MKPEQLERRRVYSKRYYLLNRETILRKHKEWLALHGRAKPSEMSVLHKKDYNKTYYEQNKVRIAERRKAKKGVSS